MRKEKIKTKLENKSILKLIAGIIVMVIVASLVVVAQGSTSSEFDQNKQDTWKNVNSANIGQVMSWKQENRNAFIDSITNPDKSVITWTKFDEIMKNTDTKIKDIKKLITDKIMTKSNPDLSHFLKKWMENSGTDGIKNFLKDIDKSTNRIDYIKKIADIILNKDETNGMSKEQKEKLVNLFNDVDLSKRAKSSEPSAREILYAKLTGLKDPNEVKIGTNFKIGYNKDNGNIELKYTFGGKDINKLSYNPASKDGQTLFPETLKGITADGNNLVLKSEINGALHTLNFDEKFLQNPNAQVSFKKNGETTITSGGKSYVSNPFTAYEKTPAVGIFSINNAGNPIFAGKNIGLITGKEISYAQQGVSTPMSVELMNIGGKTVQVSTNSWNRLSVNPTYDALDTKNNGDGGGWTNSLAFQIGTTPVAILGFGKAGTDTGTIGSISVTSESTGNNLVTFKGNVGNIKVYGGGPNFQGIGRFVALNAGGSEIFVDPLLEQRFTVPDDDGNEAFVKHDQSELGEVAEELPQETQGSPNVPQKIGEINIPRVGKLPVYQRNDGTYVAVVSDSATGETGIMLLEGSPETGFKLSTRGRPMTTQTKATAVQATVCGRGDCGK